MNWPFREELISTEISDEGGSKYLTLRTETLALSYVQAYESGSMVSFIKIAGGLWLIFYLLHPAEGQGLIGLKSGFNLAAVSDGGQPSRLGPGYDLRLFTSQGIFRGEVDIRYDLGYSEVNISQKVAREEIRHTYELQLNYLAHSLTIGKKIGSLGARLGLEHAFLISGSSVFKRDSYVTRNEQLDGYNRHNWSALMTVFYHHERWVFELAYYHGLRDLISPGTHPLSAFQGLDELHRLEFSVGFVMFKKPVDEHQTSLKSTL